MSSRERGTRGCGGVRVVAIVVVLCGAGGGAAEAQTERALEALEAGRRSIALALPASGSGELTLWRMRSDLQNRGLTVRLAASAGGSDDAEHAGSGQSISLDVGPSFRRYLSRSAPVAPYLQTDALVGASYRRQVQESPGRTTRHTLWGGSGELGVGIGAEWFPHRRASFGGHTGARLRGLYRTEGRSDKWQISLGTLTSSLYLQIYF